MLKPTPMNRFSNYIFKNYAKDSGKLLVHVGTGVTVIGASAQVGMLLADKDIQGHTKKFLVNQEIITSGTCIALFYGICETTRVAVNRIVEKGKVLTATAASYIASLNKENSIADPKAWKNIFTKEEMKKGISYNLENIKYTQIFKNTKDSLKPQTAEAAKKALEVFQEYKNGAGVLSVLAASIFAGNIAGPVIGNLIASLPTKRESKNAEE